MTFFDYIAPAITCGRYDGRVDYYAGVRVFDEFGNISSLTTPFQTSFSGFPENSWYTGLTADGTKIDAKYDDGAIHVDFYRDSTKTNYMKIHLDWSFTDGQNWNGYISDDDVSVEGTKLIMEQGDSDSATYWCFQG